jgi:uncharacterized membrane protein
VCAGDDLRKIIKNLKVYNILEKAPRDVVNFHKLSKNYLQKILHQKTGQQIKNATKDHIIQELHNITTAEQVNFYVSVIVIILALLRTKR